MTEGQNEVQAISKEVQAIGKPEDKPRPQAHKCPYCQKWGLQRILTPKGNKLECIECGNVYWASDPTGSMSTNPPILGQK